MKRILIIAVLGVFFITSFTSCSKYEDGPLLSLRSKTQRVAGEWLLQKAETNSVDVTSNFPEDYLVVFTEDGNFTITSNGADYEGTWEFNDDKTEIHLDDGTVTEVFTILRLKEKELNLTQTVSSQVTDYYYVKDE